MSLNTPVTVPLCLFWKRVIVTVLPGPVEGFLTTDLPFILPASSLCLHPSLFLIKDYTAFTLKMKDVVTCLIVWLSLKDICSLSHTNNNGWMSSLV